MPGVALRNSAVASICSQKLSITVALGLILLLAVASLVTFYQRHRAPVRTINYTELHAVGESSNAVSLSVDGETLTVTSADFARACRRFQVLSAPSG